MFRILLIVLLSVQLSVQILSVESNKTVTINATNPTTGPLLNININMSGVGLFNTYLMSSTADASQNTVYSMHSKWMQDDSLKHLYITVGDSSLGDPVCMYKFFFVQGKHYTVSFTGNNCSAPTCECSTGYGYDEEVSRYNSTYLGYVGRSYNYKLGMEVDSYAGRVLDGVGPLTVMMHIRVSDGMYVGLTTIEAKNLTGLNHALPYYNEYLYLDVNNTAPDSMYSDIPQICVDWEKANNCSAYGFDYYGNPIKQNNNSNGNWRMVYLAQVCLVLMAFLLF